MKLDTFQQEAVDLCLDESKRIVAITGAAGTGKTTIIKHVVEKLRDKGRTVRIAAPTGKAARRISEATGYDASTIHKLLEYPRPGERDAATGRVLNPSDPKRDRSNPLNCEVVIADEYMMANYEINRNLIDALPPGGRLLVFGDVNQLPPVEENKTEKDAPFEQHIRRAAVTLTHVFRQSEGSGILENAIRIQKGQMPNRKPDFDFVFSDRPTTAIRRIAEQSLSKGNPWAGLTHQIITPSRRTWVGTDALNQLLKPILNPNAEYDYRLDRHSWDHRDIGVSVGDKVVCTENMYDMRGYDLRYGEYTEGGAGVEVSFIPVPPQFAILNGEVGIITEITDGGTIYIDCGDRIVEVPHSYVEWSYKTETMFDVYPHKMLDLAYALTTHKCQGSEYTSVIYIVNKSVAWMGNRRNFYTAVTRAKESVTVITDGPALTSSLRPYKPYVRKGARK